MGAVIEGGWDLPDVILLGHIVCHDMSVREHGPSMTDDRLHVILVTGTPQETFTCSISWTRHRWIWVSVHLGHKMVLPKPRSLFTRQRDTGTRLHILIEVVEGPVLSQANRGLPARLCPGKVGLWPIHLDFLLDRVLLWVLLDAQLVSDHVLSFYFPVSDIDCPWLPSFLVRECLAKLI